MDNSNINIGVIGLGYVGLPLAVEFAKSYSSVVGFDINKNRISDLKNGHDATLELSKKELIQVKSLKYSSSPKDLSKCNFYIITVPTPISDINEPDLRNLFSATEMVGKFLKKGDYVVYESTVYPGATEEECAPILEDVSGLKLNDDFFLGYSPERINPGDKNHRLINITKVTSGSTPLAAKFINSIYASIIDAGTFLASSIKVAEAAKVIENTQRDLNIALINELSLIFNKLDIDTSEVLEAAKTKWNFLPFSPGLVGGHCIGVDPYYLTHKAQLVGYNPEIILAGRRLNESMSAHVAHRLIDKMKEKSINLNESKVLVMGCTFKENCPDTRNTKVFDVVKTLEESHIDVEIYDPWISDQLPQLQDKYALIDKPIKNSYNAIIIAVAHDVFREKGIKYIKSLLRQNSVIFDVKSLFPANETDLRL